MEARLLGSGGWLPTDRRGTACVYLREGSEVLLLDAGTGMRRLLVEPELLEGVERLSIVLSHFHLDHTAGLLALPALGAVPERELWAPARRLAGLEARDVAHRLLAPPFLAAEAEHVEERLLTSVHELGEHAEIGPFALETRLQPLHPGRSLGFRLDGFAYCTDTAFDAETAAFVRGADVLLHEAFHATDTTDDTMHSAAGEAGRVAAEADVGMLVLVHASPVEDDDAGLERHARTHFPASEVGTDGLPLL